MVHRWAKNFRGAQANQKLAFLYLANDIIQNSRRKGPEFVNEFWKALPGAVNDAVNSKDSSVRAAIDRLVRCGLPKRNSSKGRHKCRHTEGPLAVAIRREGYVNAFPCCT